MNPGNSTIGAAEKNKVAMTSVVAALFLTGTKIVVGLSTGSLGILSEAAHSALDLVAALVTVFAVRASAKPPDAKHPYGHGKFENLSALFETILLLLTCVWIIKEAVERLFSVKPYHVDPSVWGFAIIVLSIVIDIGRSRALMKTANKYQSQALEADALHFSTDVWSSGVVLVGLFLVLLSKKLGVPWLVKADALAALAVAGIVVWVSFELGMKTIRDLLDAVPAGTVDKVRALAMAVPGVEAVGRTRVRKTGGEWFADVAIQVHPDLHIDQAHELADAVEQSLREFLPGSDIVVHIEPLAPAPRDTE